MNARAAPWLAWTLCALCVALATASLILALLNGRTLAVIFLAWDGPSIAVLPTWTVSFSVIGALIASHRPENPIGWIFLAEGFCYGLLIAGDEYATYAAPHKSRRSSIGSGSVLARSVDLGTSSLFYSGLLFASPDLPPLALIHRSA